MKYSVKPRLLEILREKNITQKNLAEMTGITQASISRFDRNSQHRDEHLVLISKALNISIDELFHISIIEE